MAVVLFLIAFAVGSVFALPRTTPLETIQVQNIRFDIEDAISISATPDSVNNEEFVTVSFSGVPSPSKDDWIGLYLEGENATALSPIKFQYASASPNYLSSGSGSLQIQILNMRTGNVFYFFRNGIVDPVLAAQSNIVSIINPNEPLYARLSLNGNPSDMLVSWTTRDAGTPQVKWGYSSGALTNLVNADSYTYTVEQFCGPPATTVGWRPPGTFHTALLSGLTLASRVYYIYGDDSYGWSSEYSFPVSPAADTPIKFVAFGDLGQTTKDDSIQGGEPQETPSLNTTNGIAKEEALQFVLHVGDISYARGYAAQWEQFHDQIAPISSVVPWMTGIGNHERDYPGSGNVVGGTDSGGECGVAYETRFIMPTPGTDKPWYGFNYGPVHILMMSTEHAFNQSSEQYAYFVQDLESINRTATPWVIFAGHRPFYIDSTNFEPGDGDQTVALEMRVAFEDLLYEHQVDVIFGAHHHSYQRTCPVYKGKCVSVSSGYAAPVIVDIGMAGQSVSTNIEPVKPDIFVVVDDSHYGYTRINANATTFFLEYVRDDDGLVHDTLLLTK